MQKVFLSVLGVMALSLSSAVNATVAIDFSNPTGELGNDQVYTSGAMSVTASGYTDTNVDEHLFGKNFGGDENGVGLALDPSGQHEIYSPDSFIQLDVTALFGLASSVDFFMNSSTNGEGWAVYGNNVDAAGALGGVLLSSGTDEGTLHTLPAFGQYDFYNFFAVGPSANALLGGLSITESAVPEPATWTMMLLGFGAVGFALRRRRQTELTLRQAA